jgi:hypothetical protein
MNGFFKLRRGGEEQLSADFPGTMDGPVSPFRIAFTFEDQLALRVLRMVAGDAVGLEERRMSMRKSTGLSRLGTSMGMARPWPRASAPTHRAAAMTEAANKGLMLLTPQVP